MKIDKCIPISDDLATIFSAEFDCDDTAETWASYEAAGASFEQWQLLKESIEIFRNGLREKQLIFRTEQLDALRHPFTFLLTFTEDADDEDNCYILCLADTYLSGSQNLAETKVLLRQECGKIHSELVEYKPLFFVSH